MTRPGLLKRKGMTIGTILLLVTVGSLAIFTMVAMSFFHMRFSNVVVNQRSARNIAESALATALTQVWENNNYGSERAVDQIVHLTSSTDEGAEAFLSFNEAKATEFGVPFSTNNFQSQAAIEGGNGRTVPDSAVHLVALGICRGTRYRAEVLYYVPPYPNAMASSGPVISTGGLLVAGLPNVAAAAEITSSSGMESSKLEAGHIISNSSSPQAVSVGPNSEVRGDIVAVGGIKVSESTKILGEVRPNATAQTVPHLNVNSIFTKLEGIETRNKISDTSLPGDTIVDYFTEVVTPLTIKGNLQLDGGVLYCRDDLHVEGEVTGHGAIFALGDVKVDLGADLAANDQIAMVAKGSLELNGASQNSQFFNGLVYSEKEITASNITIIGAAVVNGNQDSVLQLDNVNLIKTPLSVSLVVGIPLTPQLGEKISIPDGKAKKRGFLSITSKETDVTLTPSDLEAQLNSSLAGGLQVSGMKLPPVKGEERYSLVIEGVFARGIGDLNSIDDLTATEQTGLDLANFKPTFKDGKIFLRYEKLIGVNREQALAASDALKAKLTAVLPEPIPYQIKTVKKKRVLFFKDKDAKVETGTFDPKAALDIDLNAFLDSLEKPTKEDNPGLIDLTLNRVFDPAETSRILLWQGF